MQEVYNLLSMKKFQRVVRRLLFIDNRTTKLSFLLTISYTYARVYRSRYTSLDTFVPLRKKIAYVFFSSGAYQLSFRYDTRATGVKSFIKTSVSLRYFSYSVRYSLCIRGIVYKTTAIMLLLVKDVSSKGVANLSSPEISIDRSPTRASKFPFPCFPAYREGLAIFLRQQFALAASR